MFNFKTNAKVTVWRVAYLAIVICLPFVVIACGEETVEKSVENLSPRFVAGDELVQNGDFSNGSTHWYLGQWGGQASGVVSSGHYIINVTSTGNQWWNVQFNQGGISLVQGKKYTFSFDAWKGPQNTGAQKMQINVGEDGGDYTPYTTVPSEKEVTLTTVSTRYSVTFEMTAQSDAGARIEFNCGVYGGTYHLDNISLTEVADSEAHLAVSETEIPFGTTEPGVSKTVSLTLSNDGALPVTVSALDVDDAAFSVDVSTPVVIANGASVDITITFAPVAEGDYAGLLSIQSDATDNPSISVALSGATILSGLSLDKQSVTLSALTTEQTSDSVVLQNSSSTAIQWSLASSQTWLSVAPQNGTITPGGVVTLNVVADAGALLPGSYSDVISITHSALNMASPVDVTVSFAVTNGYQPQSPYILTPELNIEFVRSIADFRSLGRDDTNGGFYTSLNRDGTPTSENLKSMCGQSRLAYAFVRAFMLTGDEAYLENARHALAFLYEHAYDNGWYIATDVAGNHISHWGHNNWWSFQQHYAMVGIAAMVEATGGGNLPWNDGAGSDASWLETGLWNLDTHLWDDAPSTKGYFNHASTDWTNRSEKGFTPTVDAVTTHAALLDLMFDDARFNERLMDLADNIIDHLYGSMDTSALGWPEVYDADWNVSANNTTTDVGHVYKVAWVLERVYLANRDRTELKEAAQAMMWDMWENGGYDHVNGGPFSQFNWNTGVVFNRNKDHWMLEQCVTSGLINYYVADSQSDKDMYLQVADESMRFFMEHQVDDVYGDVFDKISEDGSSLVAISKGGLFNGGYHPIELGYYTYLYSSLYYHDASVHLYYKFPESNETQNIRLTPVAIEDELFKILRITHDGAAYTNFNPDTRVVTLPPGESGIFRVTFGKVSRCGDGVCNGGEDCLSCVTDCGACLPVCNNGVCEEGETCSNCAEDCGVCPPVCDNGVCEDGETCSNCPADCGACPPVCDNGVCEDGETCSNCPADCGACPPVCDNGVCEDGEDCESCPSDCGECPVDNCTCLSGCDSVVTVNAPFTKDGSANTCYFLNNLRSYVNSWNNLNVNLNGRDVTNIYVGNWDYPAKVDGGYYLYYQGNVPWSHLEVR